MFRKLLLRLCIRSFPNFLVHKEKFPRFLKQCMHVYNNKNTGLLCDIERNKRKYFRYTGSRWRGWNSGRKKANVLPWTKGRIVRIPKQGTSNHPYWILLIICSYVTVTTVKSGCLISAINKFCSDFLLEMRRVCPKADLDTGINSGEELGNLLKQLLTTCSLLSPFLPFLSKKTRLIM